MQSKVWLKIGIKGRLIVLVGLFALGCIALASVLISLQAERAYDARMRSLEQLVATAHGVLAAHKALADAGQMPVADAQKRALKVIGNMWFGKGDYFTGRTIDGVSVLNPASPEKEGQNRDATTDSRGKRYSREMTEIVRGPGEGFVTYYTMNPATQVDSEKTSFIKLYKPWGIAIAAGVFTDDLRAETRTSMIEAGLITLLLIAILGAAAIWQSRAIVGPLARLRLVMLDLANGRSSDLSLDTSRPDEIGDMARAVQVFKENAERTRSLEVQTEEARTEADTMRSVGEAERAAVARQTQQVVHLVAEGLSQLASGDLTVRLKGFPEDYRKLEADFNAALKTLEQTMEIISGTGNAIGSGAGEISQASDDLCRRTEQQAASLEETAAALEEITATVRETAKGAHVARDIVETAKADAEYSGKVVQDAIMAMNAIERSASEIAQIIGVIDEIAFQTNLLALNAGVEAARAGEAGRGFAVVASEVRALAQRSAESAKEIKSLISNSGTQVATGVNLVGETGKSLGRIVGQVAQLATVVTEIAASAHEQAVGLEQVNTAVSHMDQITQQNAAMVEQSTAASHSLHTEAQRLNELISSFRVAKTEKIRDARAVAPSPMQKRPGSHGRPMSHGNAAVAMR